MAKERDYKLEYRRKEDAGIAEYGKTEWNRIKRAKSNTYEKTPKGFLMRAYRNIESRVNGVQKTKWHLYAGLEYMSREDFYKYLNDEDFKKLFFYWENSGYDRKLTPSPDRVDSSRGYTFENIEWVTHSENSRRGAESRHGLVF